ncbi:molybdenum cofactor biosynthesis protein A [Planctomycetes bacterium Pan216]|uniref:Molybdenum cofactor biosynthesis protein A n=1 Tax=Kolteria novifilia TaxID=2527975 RepID=A0A518B1J3_9BACT|nr:molybdenum cofactor biosynthesis protein A [Planctomycetes bacterium Pan216]
MIRSLKSRNNPLAIVDHQLDILRPTRTVAPFDHQLDDRGLAPLRASVPEILQINLGRMCNMTCKHCHVDAGPDRKEIMSRQTMAECLEVLDRGPIATVDLTGGAPEMNPDFRWLVREIRQRERRIIDRCNLTILLTPSQEGMTEFLAEYEVEIVASLPFYSASNTDRQRGSGVFEKSIEALRRLNAVGYGKPGTGRKLCLVYNPNGAFLPPSQRELEETFKSRLWDRFGVAFNELYTITNQPINRFLEYLIDSGNYEEYMRRLVDAFNPAAVEGLMCRNTISVGWDGRLYDCDFNQMLDLGVVPRGGRHVRELDLEQFAGRTIVTGLHCYACTAGSGSSCGGATT